ncbi:MAG: carbon-nitrogen hydrolase [Calditrichae bacterium]|nr:carbon-nitrogen hydrolase [Calditrichota bacterium]MCB9058997.1 carbon-nitrogen hydrolase [Calditrichia bacterium]
MSDQRLINVAIGQVGPILADLDRNIEKHCDFIEKALEQNADMIVFPELSLTGYSLKDATFDVALKKDDAKLDKIKKLSSHISVSCGFVELGDRFEFYNTQLFFEKGELLSRHRKVYLPTYGVFEEERYFSSGNRFKVFNSQLAPMGILICEDIWHAASGLILALDGASIMLVSAAGLTRGTSKGQKPENVSAWETIVKSLAISTTSYVVFVNRVGVEDGLVFWGGSEVILPTGQMLKKAEYYNEQLLTVTIDMHQLKHARLNTTLLSDEKLPVLIDEFSRIHQKNKDY